MITINDQRSANKELEAPRSYNGPMSQQPFTNSNQFYPQNTYFNPGYLHHNSVHFVQNYPLNHGGSQPLNQTTSSQAPHYLGALGYQQMYESNNYMPMQSMQRSSQQVGPYGASLMHTLTLAQVSGLGVNGMNSMGSQMANQLNSVMNGPMNTHINSPLASQITPMASQITGLMASLMGSASGAAMSLIPSQMTSPNVSQMSSQMGSQLTSQIGTPVAPMGVPSSSHQGYRGQHSQKQLIERLQELLPVPPLVTACTRPDVTLSNTHKRTKRKSKFSKRQDEMIVRLKKDGRSWVEIAEMVGIGSYLAARNRYQVIVGQQGNNNSLSWTADDRDELHKLLDSAELEKWRYIALELSKATGKNYSPEECREHARHIFWQSPTAMGVLEVAVIELQKEKRVTDRLLQAAAREDYDYLKKYNGSPELSI